MSKVHPVILCGGAGTRLWPLSTSENPKPLLRVLGDRSLLEATLERVSGEDFADPLLVCGATHARAIQAEAPGVDCLVEDRPVGTAAAVVAACRHLVGGDPDATVLILPADHVLADIHGFRRAVRAGSVAAGDGWLVMLGQVPDRAETGFGWMRVGEELDGAPGVHRVLRFVEKPDRDGAKALLAAGGHLWNMGMFLFRADTLLAEAQRVAPELVEAGGASGSLDVLVMERTQRAAVVPVALGWDDVGTWESVARLSPGGGALVVDSPGTWALSAGPTLVVNGVPGVVVVAGPEGVLVAARDRAAWRTREARLTIGARARVRGTLVRGRLVDETGRQFGVGALVDGVVDALEPSLVVEVSPSGGG